MRRRTHDLPLDERDAPAAGDLFVGPVALYRITDARPVDSTQWGNRWSLAITRIGDAVDLEAHETPDTHVWAYRMYRRGETPADIFGELWPPQEAAP